MKISFMLFTISFLFQVSLHAQTNTYQGYTYSFQVPIGWVTSEDPTGTVDIILNKIPTSNTTNFSVTTKGVAIEKDLYKIRSSIIDPIKQKYGNVVVVREERISIIDNPSDLLFEVIIKLQDGREVTIIQYLFVMNNVNYVVSGLELGTDKSELVYAMEVVMDSFKPKN